MKKIIIILFITLISCSKDTTETTSPLHTYQYSTTELELFDRINQHRDSIGLNILQTNQHISYVCWEHNNYMIRTGRIKHDYFQSRVENLQLTIGAYRIGENIAYNYQTPKSTLNAWLNSPGHRQNIEGDYTDFGLSITRGTNQRNYITLILVKK